MLLDELRLDLGGDRLAMARRGIQVKVKQRGLDVPEYLHKVLDYLREGKLNAALSKYAELGVKLLSEATPVDTGLTASSWYSEIEHESDDCIVIRWLNSNVQRGINIALILDVGHGTGTGGWIEGRNYIDPTMQPMFDSIAEECWSEVTRI